MPCSCCLVHVDAGLPIDGDVSLLRSQRWLIHLSVRSETVIVR